MTIATNSSSRATRVSRVIQASPETLYAAFMDPDALTQWLPPGDMTGRLHAFDGRIGGGYEMSLYYPEEVALAPAGAAAHPPVKTGAREDRVRPEIGGESRLVSGPGKTSAREDRVRVHFLELAPGRRIVEAVSFVSDNPDFSGAMGMTISFLPAAAGSGTEVTILSENLPPGLTPADNAEGSRLSLEQLARWLGPSV